MLASTPPSNRSTYHPTVMRGPRSERRKGGFFSFGFDPNGKDDPIKITRTSSLTGKERTREMNLTPEQLTAWEQGELIQNVAPHLTDAEREFVMTGITAEEWTAVFGTDEDDDASDDADEGITIH